MSGPRENDQSRHGPHASEVDHPDGLLDVEVVEYGAAVYAVVGLFTVHGARRVTSHPLLLAGVTLMLASVVNERLLLERQILHCATAYSEHKHVYTR